MSFSKKWSDPSEWDHDPKTCALCKELKYLEDGAFSNYIDISKYLVSDSITFVPAPTTIPTKGDDIDLATFTTWTSGPGTTESIKVDYEKVAKKWESLLFQDAIYIPEGIASKQPYSAVNPDGPLMSAIPSLRARTTCPAACGLSNPVAWLIVHLNDSERWTREQIADWLDTLDLDLSFPTPETPDGPESTEKEIV